MSDTRVALVTGASRGIGRQVAADLAIAGYDVVCTARSSADSPGKLPGTIDETAQRVRDAGRRAMPVALDVRDEAGVSALATRVMKEWGRCDLLVNNAAVAPPGTTVSVALKHWRLAFDVNVHGPMYFIRHFAPHMQAQGEGRIVNISSGSSVEPAIDWASYMVTKAALESLTVCTAHELRPNVAVNCIRLELNVYSEGYETRISGGETMPDFEDPVIMSDAVHWFATQPLTLTGEIKTIGDLRKLGVVRSQTRWELPA